MDYLEIDITENWKRLNEITVRRAIRRKYPLTVTEKWLLLQRIRIERFIDNQECKKCKFATEDHTIGWLFSTKICVKDWLKKTKQDGLPRSKSVH